MYYLLWHTEWEGHHLIVSPTKRSVLKTFQLGLESSDDAKPLHLWEGEECPVPAAVLNVQMEYEYENRYQGYLDNIDCLMVEASGYGPPPPPFFEDGKGVFDHYLIDKQFSLPYDLRAFYEAQNPKPPPLPHEDFAPLFLVEKSFGHHRRGLTVRKMTMVDEDFTPFDIALAFRGEELPIWPELTAMVEEVEARRAELVRQRNEEMDDRKSTVNVVAQQQLQELLAQLEAQAPKL